MGAIKEHPEEKNHVFKMFVFHIIKGVLLDNNAMLQRYVGKIEICSIYMYRSFINFSAVTALI